MTDTEKAALEARIDELYAKLGRTQLNCDMWHDRAKDMRNRLSAAQAENAKLSKLVQYILDECYGDDWFGEKAEGLGFRANY